MSKRGSESPSLLGAVLAGGRGRRLGRAKWSEPVAGIPMALRAAAALTTHVREVVLIAPDAAPAALGLQVVADAPGGGGPLAGIVAALEYAAAHGDGGVLVLACDLPLVDPGFLGALIAAWSGEDLVAPELGGLIQPVCALWSTAVLPAATAALASTDRSPLNLAKRLRVKTLLEAEWRAHARSADPLLNVNTAEDLTRAETLLSGSDPDERG